MALIHSRRAEYIHVMAYESPFAISICPGIRADEHRLTASTSWIVRIVALGFLLRHVIVDRRSQTVTIEQRTGWFFRRQQVIRFAEIIAVTYGYEDVNPFGLFSTTHDALDRYVVGLRVGGRDEVPLFFFLGDGVFTNDGPMPDWWYWDEYITDFTGTQERESKLFVQLLSKLIGVEIRPSSLTRE